MNKSFKILKGPTEEEQKEAFKDLSPYEMLWKAAEHGSLKWVKEALKRGADIHANNDVTFQWAIINAHFDIIKFLLDKGINVNMGKGWPLKWASAGGHLKIVKLFLDRGANIHAENDAALRYAIHNGYSEIVEFLFKRGANKKYSKNWVLNNCKIEYPGPKIYPVIACFKII